MKVLAVLIAFAALLNFAFGFAVALGAGFEGPSDHSIYGGIATAQIALAWLLWESA